MPMYTCPQTTIGFSCQGAATATTTTTTTTTTFSLTRSGKVLDISVSHPRLAINNNNNNNNNNNFFAIERGASVLCTWRAISRRVALSKLGLPDSETCTRQQTG